MVKLINCVLLVRQCVVAAGQLGQFPNGKIYYAVEFQKAIENAAAERTWQPLNYFFVLRDVLLDQWSRSPWRPRGSWIMWGYSWIGPIFAKIWSNSRCCQCCLCCRWRERGITLTYWCLWIIHTTCTDLYHTLMLYIRPIHTCTTLIQCLISHFRTPWGPYWRGSHRWGRGWAPAGRWKATGARRGLNFSRGQ